MSLVLLFIFMNIVLKFLIDFRYFHKIFNFINFVEFFFYYCAKLINEIYSYFLI